MRFITVVAVLATLLMLAQTPASAIPPYARQLGVECTQCHTVWPRLNAFGRQFKIKGYVDTSPLGDTKLPFALRVKVDAESTTSSAPGQPATTDKLINFPAEAMLFLGGPLSKRLGTFVQVTTSRNGNHFETVLDTARLAYNMSQSHPASLTIFKGDMFGADPYPSLGGMGFTPFSTDSAAPLFLQNGFLLAPLESNNYGIVYHGYLDAKNRFYGAVGAQTGGLLPDSLAGSNRVSTQSLKYYTRLAYESPVGDRGGVWNVGAAYMWGTENVMPPDPSVPAYGGRVSRLFVDAGLQLPVGKGKRDMFEIIGLYNTGMDRNITEFDPNVGVPNGPFDAHVGGLYLQADYYFNGTFGPQVYYDTSRLGPTTFHTAGVGLAWLPQRDFKIGVSALLTNGTDGSKNTLYGIYFTKYFYKPVEQVAKEEKEEREQKKTSPQSKAPEKATPGPSAALTHADSQEPADRSLPPWLSR